ncbi:MAG: hypothetical protein J6X61_00805, partial [Clostridia bacterium]|nr:hypothetical protein [Clostridia bacterium]
CATHCADYDEVGPSADSDGDYATVAAQDKYSNSSGTNASIPYIIRKYTQKDGSMYRARSLCGSSTVASITLSGGTYNMPGGFRGIGSIYRSSNSLRIQFKQLIGSNTNLHLAMNYQEYNHESGEKDSKTNLLIENVKPYEGAGFGLFNAVYLSGFDANSDTNSVKDLTLSGSVFYDIRKVADFNNYGAAAYPNLTSALMKQAGDSILYAYGWSSYVKDKVEQTAFYPDPADRLEAKTILHVGGVAGVSSTNGLYLKNVTLSNLSVEGAKYVGGAVGFSTKAIVIDAPSASGLSVTAGFAAGGLVGGFSSNAASGKATTANANLTIKGASANSPAVIDQSNVQVKGYPSAARIIFNNGSDFAYMFHCAGGLVGYACTGTGNTVTVQNVTVSGGAISALHADFRPNDMRYKIIAGGLFGRLEKSGVLFENVTVYGVDIFANESGGLIGVSRDALNGSMTNIVVDGGDVNLTKKIDGTNIAGGLIAFHSENASLDLTLDNILVANYTITSSHNNAEKAGAGGLVGALRTGGTRFNIINSVIRNVKVSRGSTNNDNAQNDNGLGGVFGALTNNHTIVRGHNLLIDGVILEKRGGSYNPGMLVGNNNSHNIKFVGVSIQGGSSATVPVVATGNYGTSGYVVMADYDGDCKTDEKNTAWRTIYNSNGNPVANTNELAAAAPYVTVNDAGNVGSSGLFLTGDGIAPTVADLPIQEIRGNSVIDKRYAYANNYRTACNLSKLSTYNYEQNTTLTDDFAVLIVDDVSRINTTNLINAYLNLLAGTNEDYTANKSNVYAVDLYKMSWNEGQGRFVISASGNTNTNLKRSNGQFYMDINSVDTGNNTFTLIDVKFYDPNATTKVAYHLYVPVLVKKMLTFDFEIATGNGTNYQRAWYDDRFGKPIMENLGTPATIFFKYTYQRTQDEWQNAINGGENVQSRNFTKTLTLTKQDAINDLPSDTLLVLVDVNRGGKPYYATFGSAYNAATGTLSLSAFHENLGDNTSATAFTPVSLGALLCQGETQGLTATQANDGGLMITDEAHATVKAYLGGVETYFRAATDGTNEADRYTVSVAKTDGADGYIPLEEAYYISFFTDATTSNNVYHYTISAPVSFNDPSNPSRIADPDKLQNHEGTVHMILGNIFVQTGVSLTTTPNNTEMSVLTGNHVVTATMGATVTIHADLKSEVQGYLGANSGINVFHSFLLQLTRNDETSSRKIITGSPAVDGTYVIASANGDVAATDPADQVITVTNGYAEIHSSNLTQNINEYLVGGNGAVISATLSLNYGTDAAISAQFPSREDTTNVSVGTKATCSSNLAYDRANTASSKVAQGAADSADHSYYCRIDNRRASLSYNVKSDVFLGDYGPLGINPLAEDAVDEMPVSTLAVYDISEIVTPATGYDLVRVRVRLHQRVDNYAADLALSTYMTEVSVKGYDNDTVRNTDSTTEYVFTLPRAALASNSAVATALEIPLNYKVLTGATFEAAGLTYSNYKISLSVELTKSSNTADVLDVSLATDYLVYTNARVLPDYVEIVSP